MQEKNKNDTKINSNTEYKILVKNIMILSILLFILDIIDLDIPLDDTFWVSYATVLSTLFIFFYQVQHTDEKLKKLNNLVESSEKSIEENNKIINEQDQQIKNLESTRIELEKNLSKLSDDMKKMEKLYLKLELMNERAENSFTKLIEMQSPELSNQDKESEELDDKEKVSNEELREIDPESICKLGGSLEEEENFDV